MQMGFEIWLKVPYQDKDEAKALGARWNATFKRWYIPEDAAIEPLERWLTWDGS